MKTAVGGHSVESDTSVSLIAEEKLLSSEEEMKEDNDDDDDEQPEKKRRRVVEERHDILEAKCNTEPAADCHSEQKTPFEESRD